MLSARGMASNDTLVEVSIVSPSQVSFNEEELMSINAVRFSLRIELSKCVGSEKKSYFFLLLLVLMDMYLKNKKCFCR